MERIGFGHSFGTAEKQGRDRRSFTELPYCFVAWERVLTVNDFWDGPRRGIAEVSGRPHINESPFNDRKDDFEEFFWGQPIDVELLALVLEDWDIWNLRSW